MSGIEIIDYQEEYRNALLEVLLELQDKWYHESAPIALQELNEEKDIKNTYQRYVEFLNAHQNKDWKTLLAIAHKTEVAGFIIGSIERDQDLVKSNIAKFEDWFVVPSHRKSGLGSMLYVALENWFIENGCEQVISETWMGNYLAVLAHQQLGFFQSGILFSKKLNK